MARINNLIFLTSSAMAPGGSDETLQEEGHSANSDGPENPYKADWAQIEEAFQAGNRQAVLMVVDLFENAGKELLNHSADEIYSLHDQAGVFLFGPGRDGKDNVRGYAYCSEKKFSGSMNKVFEDYEF